MSCSSPRRSAPSTSTASCGRRRSGASGDSPPTVATGERLPASIASGRAKGAGGRSIAGPAGHRRARRLPGFAIVIHRGRTSGRRYRTPVNAFARPDGGYALALTYGPDSQWVRNVVAQGGCTLEATGRRVELANPRVVHDPSRRPVPPPVRAVLALLRVEYFLELDRTPG